MSIDYPFLTLIRSILNFSDALTKFSADCFFRNSLNFFGSFPSNPIDRPNENAASVGFSIKLHDAKAVPLCIIALLKNPIKNYY